VEWRVSVAQIAEAIDMLHQLQQHIEALRQDFLVHQAAHSHVPHEVSTFHFRREMVVLERQLRHALIIAFGDASAEVRQYREVGFAHSTAHGVEQCQLILDQSIAELEQRRLHLLEPTRVPQLGIDPTTDLYTDVILSRVILSRYLEHEIAWSQRHGESFALLPASASPLLRRGVVRQRTCDQCGQYLENPPEGL
jgi:hypothetical protein